MNTADLQAFRNWLADRLLGEMVTAGPLLPKPDRQVAVMDYNSAAPANWQGYYWVQIRCRSRPPGPAVNAYLDAHGLADAVVAVVAPPDQGGVVVPLIDGRPAILRKTSGPLPMGIDEKGRWELTINVTLDTSRV